MVPADEVYPTAQAMAAKFAKGPALALRPPRRPSTAAWTIDLANGLKLESHVFAGLFATEDKQRGMASFIENGPGKAEFVGN